MKKPKDSNGLHFYLKLGISDSDGVVFDNNLKQMSAIMEVFVDDNSFKDEHDLKIDCDILNQFFISNFKDIQATINFYHIRDNNFSTIHKDVFTEDSFASELAKNYNIESSNLYKSRYYFEVIQKLSKSYSESDRELFNSLIDRLCAFFNDKYAKVGATTKRLSTYQKNGKTYDEVLNFYANIISGNHPSNREYLYTDSQLMDCLFGSSVAFANDTGVSYFENDKERIKYFKVIEFVDCTDYLAPNILNELISLDCKFIIKNSFTFQSKKESIAKLERFEKNLKISESRVNKAYDEVNLLLAEVRSDEQALGSFSSIIQIYENNEATLSKRVDKVVNKLNSLGLVYRFAKTIGVGKIYLGSLVSSYMSLYTFTESYNQRINDNVTSEMFFNLSLPDNVIEGKFKGTPWGSSICTLKSLCNTAYHFNFHTEDFTLNELEAPNPGHTLILGSTGSGKTVFMNFLLTMAMKFSNTGINASGKPNDGKFNLIFFDKDFGGKLNILANDGVYYSIKADEPTGLNPFLCEPTNDNIRILIDLIKLMLGKDISVSIEQEETLQKAIVATLFLQDHARKNNTVFYPITGLVSQIPKQNNNNSSIITRLLEWTKDGIYGWVFDNGALVENLDFQNNSVIGIDGTYFLSNEKVKSPITYYILTKVNNSLNGTKTIIAFDEVWSWLIDDTIRHFIYDKLKTMRKLNAIAVLATQSPEEILQSEIGSTICQQCSTRILLPNKQADEEMYKKIGVSSLEFQRAVKLLSKRQAFIKKPNYSILVDTDLSSLPKQYLDLLSANPSNIKLVEKLINQYGAKYKDWIRYYEIEKNYISNSFI